MERPGLTFRVSSSYTYFIAFLTTICFLILPSKSSSLGVGRRLEIFSTCNRRFQLWPSFLFRETRWFRGRGNTSKDHLDLKHILSWIWHLSHLVTKALSPEMYYFSSRPDTGSPLTDLLSFGKINNRVSHLLPSFGDVFGLWGDFAVDDLAGRSFSEEGPSV